MSDPINLTKKKFEATFSNTLIEGVGCGLLDKKVGGSFGDGLRLDEASAKL